jgi:ABC-2 type transport system ATP-binding protein
VIRVEHLTKRFGKVLAVDDLSFALERGTVTGFLGPNGAGKTTTLRMLLHLVEPSAGRALVFGGRYVDLERPASRVGAVLEAADFHPGRSGYDHLFSLALALGHTGGGNWFLGRERAARQRVDAVLDLVELTAAAHRRVGGYSLGMRQRLGLAGALLGDPELLILDEPANGLDPAGIVEVRELIRSLGAEGRTVFVSSHILSEVQQVADQVAIVAKGKLITSGPVDRVLASGGARGLIVRLADLSAGATALGNAGFSSTRAGDALQVDAVPERAADVTRALADAGLYLTELRADEADLETVFLELTKDKGVGD